MDSVLVPAVGHARKHLDVGQIQIAIESQLVLRE
jgi:hypothetical protein